MARLAIFYLTLLDCPSMSPTYLHTYCGHMKVHHHHDQIPHSLAIILVVVVMS